MSQLIRVGVLRGGPSNEYEVSLKSGAEVLSALNGRLAEHYRPKDIFIDRAGVWHMDGVSVAPERALKHVDVVFNALHGTYGEDGKVQAILEHHRVPFTGTGSLGSALGMNKALAKKILSSHGLKGPFHIEIPSADVNRDPKESVRNIFQKFSLPAVIKPTGSGSSVGVSIVTDYGSLAPALVEAAKHSSSVMLEEYVKGIEATCGVIEGFRGQDLYALPPIEIRPKTHFFSYEAKYAGQSEEIVPATFSQRIKKTVEELSIKIHRALGLRHYSRSDFIIHPTRGVVVLEVNTLPGLTGESLIPKALRAVGSDTHELIDHLIKLALNR